MPKHIDQRNIIGEQGINLIQHIVLGMGYAWYSTGSVEAGIDGWIEIRDPVSGEVRNAMIPVQSKATTKRFQAETDSSLEYRCKNEDLDYWLGGTGQVILIHSRPLTSEAYWVPLKRYFAEHADDRARGVVRFDKKKDSFSAGCAEALVELAAPRELGVYFGLSPKAEQLWSNLLPVSLPSELWVARACNSDAAELWRTLRTMYTHPPGNWAVAGSSILSFRSLDEPPLNLVCEPGTAECFSTEEWADSSDPDRQRNFVRLLNRTLTAALDPDVRYDRDRRLYYVAATGDFSSRSFTYQSRVEPTSRIVFRGYPRHDGSGIAYYRHSAFAGRFRRFEGHSYLEIVPSYVYTLDGRRPSIFTGQLLANIKRLERNDSVLAQVLMWASHIQQTLAGVEAPKLEIGSAITFDVEAGLDDGQWRHGDETFPDAADSGESDLQGEQPGMETKAARALNAKSESRRPMQEDVTDEMELGRQMALFSESTMKYRWRPRRSRGTQQEGK